jgi:NUMOD4 motif/HNH endonuclease
MIEEIWKPVPGFEATHEASNLGRVRSIDRIKEYKQHNVHGDIVDVRRKFKGQILKTYKTGPRKERMGIDLADGEGIEGVVHKRGRYSLARLVWETFMGSIKEDHWVHHKNRNWADCELSNLIALPVSEVLDKRDRTNLGHYERNKKTEVYNKNI